MIAAGYSMLYRVVPTRRPAVPSDGIQDLVHAPCKRQAILDFSPSLLTPKMYLNPSPRCPSCASGLAEFSGLSAWAAVTPSWVQALTVISPQAPASVLHGAPFLKCAPDLTPTANAISDLLVLCTSVQSVLGILMPQDVTTDKWEGACMWETTKVTCESPGGAGERQGQYMVVSSGKPSPTTCR